MLRPARPGGKMHLVWATPVLREAARRDRAVGEPACVPALGLRLTPVATWPLPLAACSPWLPSLRPRRGPLGRRVVDARPLAAPRRGGRFAGLAPPERAGGGRVAPLSASPNP